MGDHLKSLASPQDKPDIVRVKIKQIRDELEASGRHDQNTLQEAAEFLQDKWHDFQQSLNRTGTRVKEAMDSAWKRLTHKF